MKHQHHRDRLPQAQQPAHRRGSYVPTRLIPIYVQVSSPKLLLTCGLWPVVAGAKVEAFCGFKFLEFHIKYEIFDKGDNSKFRRF